MSHNKNTTALDALFWREEILQVLYWLHGEGLAEAVPFSRLQSLLNTDTQNLLFHLQKNATEGLLHTTGKVHEKSTFTLTAEGKKKAAQIFRNAFEGMQKAGHGECGPDCEFCYIDGEKTEDCVHNCADSRHHH